MKILQINKYHYIKGGADSVFFNTGKLLENHGHIVIPFCIKHSNNEQTPYSSYFVNASEIRELNSINKAKNFIRFLWNSDASLKIEKVIKSEKPNIAHIHNLFNGISLSILPILKKYNIPVVITIHDTRFICPSSYFNLRGELCKNCLRHGCINCGLHRCYQNNFLYSWMCVLEMFHKEKIFHYDQYIDQYIFVSKRYKEFHLDKHSYFSKKGNILYNFLPNIEKRSFVSKKGKYIFYYGRITIEKGIKTLIEAMKSLPMIMLKVAGTGPLLDELKTLSLPNVDFLGFKSGTELFKEIQDASFVIVPSECYENNPLTIIESYACGKPVIGANIGGIPEIIIDNETGYIFEPHNTNNLLQTIQMATSISDEKYINLSQSARSFAERYFSPDNHYNQLMKIYNQAIQQNENT